MSTPLFKIREKNKYGFIDADGEIIIEPQYLQVEDFHNNFARVKVFDKILLMDEAGRLLLKRVFKRDRKSVV